MKHLATLLACAVLALALSPGAQAGYGRSQTPVLQQTNVYAAPPVLQQQAFTPAPSCASGGCGVPASQQFVPQSAPLACSTGGCGQVPQQALQAPLYAPQQQQQFAPQQQQFAAPLYSQQAFVPQRQFAPSYAPAYQAPLVVQQRQFAPAFIPRRQFAQPAFVPQRGVFLQAGRVRLGVVGGY